MEHNVQWGEIGEHNFGDFWFFSQLFLVFLGFYGVYIIPKWLINKGPRTLQYFLDDFGNFEKFVKIWTRIPPNYYQHASKKTRKYGIIFKIYYFHI